MGFYQIVTLPFQAYYLSFLSDPVSSGLSLQIILGVPVRVKDDYCVSGCQVDTETTRSR